jgi:hypothetical protein
MYACYGDDFDPGIRGISLWRQSLAPINDAGILNCGRLIGCGTEQGTCNLGRDDSFRGELLIKGSRVPCGHFCASCLLSIYLVGSSLGVMIEGVLTNA